MFNTIYLKISVPSDAEKVVLRKVTIHYLAILCTRLYFSFFPTKLATNFKISLVNAQLKGRLTEIDEILGSGIFFSNCLPLMLTYVIVKMRPTQYTLFGLDLSFECTCTFYCLTKPNPFLIQARNLGQYYTNIFFIQH